jgi:hypothetical protein
MALLTPSPGLEDRVMQEIRAESSEGPQSEHAAGSEPGDLKKTYSRSPIWRPELFNGMIATAATYLFISSGILGKIIAIHTIDWETEVQSKFKVIGQAVHKLSMYLIS